MMIPCLGAGLVVKQPLFQVRQYLLYRQCGKVRGFGKLALLHSFYDLSGYSAILQIFPNILVGLIECDRIRQVINQVKIVLDHVPYSCARASFAKIMVAFQLEEMAILTLHRLSVIVFGCLFFAFFWLFLRQVLQTNKACIFVQVDGFSQLLVGGLQVFIRQLNCYFPLVVIKPLSIAVF